ncbi:penicillin-binding protein [Jannaschia sp. R86511]|uniref:penicillin-binding protein n=1 Tax=Jannaschia sp. R86511 TaxID=3093853 RepID=UPI0036D2E3DF
MREQHRAVIRGHAGGRPKRTRTQVRGRSSRSLTLLRHDDSGNAATGFLRVLTLLAAFVAVALVAGVLAAGLALPTAAAAGYLTRSGSDFYEELPEELEIPPLSQTSRMVAADDSLIATFYSENRSQTSLNRMGEWAPKAIVAIEDERFYSHGGLDTRGTLRALGNNILGGSQQGASTLTQQYVKQVQLESAVYSGDPEELARVQAEINASGPVGYGRKLREAKLAISLEEDLSKDEILERYLNIANFGNATYGIQAAAQRYFSRNAEDLLISQAALLAGVVQAPSRWDPLDNPEAALERRNTVLFRMLDTGALTQEQYDKASTDPIMLEPRETQRGCITAGELAYFCDYVEQLILTDPAYGETRAERENLLLRGGLRIETTIDPDVQSVAWDAVRSQVDEEDRAGVAMSVVEPGTGDILAMAQNRIWGYDPEDERQTTVNYNVDQRYNGGGGFQPGSNMKPIVLATWLESGRPLNDRVPAPEERTFRYGDFQVCGERLRPYDETYTPGNSGGTAASLSIAEATFRSSNTAYIGISQQLDLCDIRDMAERLGWHPAVDPDGLIQPVPSMALGSAEVAPLSVANAYATFAADGVHCDTVAITRITDRTGGDLPVPAAECNQELDPEVARGVNEALQETLIQGTADSSTFDGVAAGKTGTTNDFVAVWFTGYTQNLAASVFVGDPGTDGTIQGLNDFDIQGTRYRQVFGSTLAVPTWDAFMNDVGDVYDLQADGFPEPDDDIVLGEQFAVPDVVGEDADDAREELEALGLRVAVSSERRFSNSVAEGDVAAQSPSSGALQRSGGSVTLILSDGEEPPPPPEPEPEPEPEPSATPETSPTDGGGGDQADPGGGDQAGGGNGPGRGGNGNGRPDQPDG